MRICLASLHPRILSGQIDSLAGLGRALVRHGHDVTLVAPCETDGLLDGSLISLDSGPKGLMSAAMRMLRAVPRIVAEAKNADIVHLALPTPAFSFVADVVQAAVRVPVLVGYEGHLVPARRVLRWQRLRKSWKTYLPLWGVNNGLFGRMSAYRCPGYVVSSNYQRDELVALGVPSGRVTILSNMIESSKMEMCDPIEARTRLGLPQGKTVVGYIGHLNDVKGVDVLAEAFIDVVHRHPQAHLALAWSGQGNDAPIREALAPVADHVTWLGKVHVGRFLCAVDMLALPYRLTAGQGTFPSLVLEAMHAGCPLITSKLPLLEEVVEDGVNGLLCPTERADILADQLSSLISSPDLRVRIAKAELETIKTRFVPDRLVTAYEALYASLVHVQEWRRAAAAAA